MQPASESPCPHALVGRMVGVTPGANEDPDRVLYGGSPELVLFDLGGELIELRGVALMAELAGIDDENELGGAGSTAGGSAPSRPAGAR